ncbi:MAG: hypothetical protein NTX79_04900 [Candidatus Micrarchaeota archaeon]|nr:hypothetical protein [Candidatus Micrarchaeota archaeon]
MIVILPTFKGYTIDVRLGQFRKVSRENGIEFLDFDEEEGDELLAEYLGTLNLKKAKDKAMFDKIADIF